MPEEADEALLWSQNSREIKSQNICPQQAASGQVIETPFECPYQSGWLHVPVLLPTQDSHYAAPLAGSVPAVGELVSAPGSWLQPGVALTITDNGGGVNKSSLGEKTFCLLAFQVNKKQTKNPNKTKQKTAKQNPKPFAGSLSQWLAQSQELL